VIVKQARTLKEAVELLSQYESSKIIAGGTDIVIQIYEKRIHPKALIDISKVDELKKIEEKDDYIEIGAGVTYTDIMESSLFEGNLKGFKKACSLVGSPQIRNRGTIGGNIVNASPAADSIPPLIALESTLILVSKRGKREVKIQDYFSHGKTFGIREDELLTAIRFRKPKGVLTFAKLGLRKALAISRISISALVDLDEDNRVIFVRIASGSIGKLPMREYEVEEFLHGKVFEENVVDESVKVLQESMDKRLAGRPTLPYKRRAIEAVLKEALSEVRQ
jgi:CO/xanthine dehydrogenase FAD-binding subunit